MVVKTFQNTGSHHRRGGEGLKKKKKKRLWHLVMKRTKSNNVTLQQPFSRCLSPKAME